MKMKWLCAALLAPGLLAAAPDDFVRQWPVLGSCAAAAGAVLVETPVHCEGAFAVILDESLYRQTTRADLADVAAFNADGEALPFGPMPPGYGPPEGSWHDAAWFALPPRVAAGSGDLHLHIQRSAGGDLQFDASLSRAPDAPLRDLLIDVRAEERNIEAIALELALDAEDFSARVAVDASDDLEHWREVLPGATVAQLRQGGQSLVRRHIEFPAQPAAYLRLRVEGAAALPLRGVRLLLHPPRVPSESIERSEIAADFVRREGRAFFYRLPARVPVERVDIRLSDRNAIANFSVSAREQGERDWDYIGQVTAFRLRAAGVALDNEAMDTAITRQQEWRIESSVDLDHAPELQLSYRPESWLLLTHGKAPYVVAAGSVTARRGAFPLQALVSQVRARYGRGWQPPPASLGSMQTAGGEAALSAYDPRSRRTWLLWGVLVLGAAVIVVMVVRLLRVPPDD